MNGKSTPSCFPYLYDGADTHGHDHQVARLLVHQVQEDDDLGEGAPQHRLGGEAGEGAAAAPELDVVLERQKVEQQLWGNRERSSLLCPIIQKCIGSQRS